MFLGHTPSKFPTGYWSKALSWTKLCVHALISVFPRYQISGVGLHLAGQPGFLKIILTWSGWWCVTGRRGQDIVPVSQCLTDSESKYYWLSTHKESVSSCWWLSNVQTYITTLYIWLTDKTHGISLCLSVSLSQCLTVSVSQYLSDSMSQCLWVVMSF